MDKEEFERIKEAEKERLQAKKKLAELKRALGHKRKIQQAVNSMALGASSLLRRSADLVEQLASETALQEALLEMALDDTGKPSSSDEEDLAAYEENRERARAERLVRQIKQSMGSSPKRSAVPPSESKTSSSDSDATSSPESRSTSDDDLPEKTIGRMNE